MAVRLGVITAGDTQLLGFLACLQVVYGCFYRGTTPENAECAFAGAILDARSGAIWMYIKKSRGPIMLPCGTPQLISLAFEIAPLTLHF